MLTTATSAPEITTATWMSAPAAPEAPDGVHEEEQHAEPDAERAERRDQVPEAPAHIGAVRVDPPRHSHGAEVVLRKERQVEREEDDPELPAPERLSEQAAGDL